VLIYHGEGDCQVIISNIREVRLNLSKLLNLVESGEEIIIKNRNTPVAKIVPYRKHKSYAFPDLTKFRASIELNESKTRLTTEEIVRKNRDER
jgi:prevent-host-death family protein